MKTSKRITVLLAAAVLALPMASCSHGGDTTTTTAPVQNGTEVTVTTRDMSSEAAALESQISVVPGGAIDAGLFFVDNPGNENPIFGTEPPAVTTMIGEDGSAYVAKTDINGTNVTQADGALATELFTGTVVPATYAEPDYQPKMQSYLSMWLDTSKKGDYAFEGEFLTYEIKVKEDAKDGIYPINFYHLDFSNYAGDSLPAYANYGYICINKDKPEVEKKLEGITLVPDIVTAKPGDTIQYKVNIEQNTGIAGFVLRMHYDSNAFQIVSGTNGKDFEIKSRITAKDVS